MLASLNEHGKGWQPHILRVPVQGALHSCLIAFDDYAVGEEFINRIPAAAGGELIFVIERQWRDICRQCSELGINHALIYFELGVDNSLLFRAESPASFVSP